MINNWLTFNGKGLTSHAGYALGTDQYGPIPPLTLRIRYPSGIAPNDPWTGKYSNCVCTLVSGPSESIWDITPPTTNWRKFFANDIYLLEVLGANMEGVTDLSFVFQDDVNLVNVESLSLANVQSVNGMFYQCTRLQSVGDFYDTVGTTDMSWMFYNCSNLRNFPAINCSTVENFQSMFLQCFTITGAIPLYDTSSATDMRDMLSGTYDATTGALALYQQASSQANPPAQHSGCFYSCGSRTDGRDDVLSIPTSWGGVGGAMA